MPVYGSGGPRRAEDGPFDGLDRRAGGAELVFEDGPLDAGVDDGDGHALAGRPRIAEDAVGGEPGEDFVEHRRLGHRACIELGHARLP